MAKLNEIFKVFTVRPFSAHNVVSIAELAQFTNIEITSKFPVKDAFDILEKEWKFEIDFDDNRYHMGFKYGNAIFKDGSQLKFVVKK